MFENGLPYQLKDGLVNLSGKCEECIPHCAAHCCKAYMINLTAEEAVSGQYEMEHENYSGNPTYYQFRLRKKKVHWSPYEMCVYLNEDYKCSIYDKRPFSCQQFTCQNKSIHMRHFRGFTDFAKLIKDGAKGEQQLKLVENSPKVTPSIDSIGVIWAMLGDYKTFEDKLRNLLEGLDDNTPFSAIANKVNLLIENMTDAVFTIEDEFQNQFFKAEKEKIIPQELKNEEKED